jgi:hypothetical protein
MLVWYKADIIIIISLKFNFDIAEKISLGIKQKSLTSSTNA